MIVKRIAPHTIVIVLVLTALLSSGVFAAAQPTPTHTLLLFPVASKVMSASTPQLVDDMFLLMKEQLSALGTYHVIAYDPNMVTIRRAVEEQRLDAKTVTDPFDTTPAGTKRACAVCKQIGVDLAVMVSIDKFRLDAEKGEAEVAATLQLIDTATETVKKTMTATGVGKVENSESRSEETMGIQAISDVAEKLLAEGLGVSDTELTGAPAPVQQPVESPAPRKKSKWGMLPMAVGALLLGFFISGG